MSSPDISESWISNGLCAKSKEKAAAELNETDERKATALDELRKRIDQRLSTDTNLKLPRTDDAFLIRFLRARKFDVDNALRLLVCYTNFRSNHNEVFEGVTLESIRPLLEHKVVFVMRERDGEGRRVMLFQPALVDLSRFTAREMQAAFVYVLDALIQDEETQVNGFIMIEDYTNMTMMKMMMFDQSYVKLILELVQDAFPARFKGFHMVNQPWFFSMAWGIAKPFLKEKMKSRLFLHGSDMASLHKALSTDSLPAEVGGSRSSYDPAELVDFLSKASVERPPKPVSSSV